MLYDKDIREPLFEYLETLYGKVRIFEEKVIGKTRADVMMVTRDALWGIEIKSDADTYARLQRQVKDYNRFFDFNMVVVGSTHAKSVMEHVPEYWGILSVEEEEEGKEKTEVNFYLIREPQRNPKREKEVLFRNQMSILWRPEIAHLQEINHMYKYKNLSKINVIKKIMETVERQTLKEQLCQELFERDYSTIAQTIEEYKRGR